MTGQVDQKFIYGELLQVIFYILTTHALRWSVIRMGWLTLKWYSLVPRFLVAILSLSLLHYGFLILISYAMNNLSAQDYNPLTILANLLASFALMFVWSLIYMSFHYFDRYNKSLQYEAAIKEVELNALKSQLNPHFIFNALNSIRALVDENPKQSKNAITQLSNILRNSLKTQRKKLVPFEEELSTVRDYLELESIRYEERLKTNIDVDPNCLAFDVPPLMLQTLVENGIKHGIAHLKNGGVIDIRGKIIDDGMQIQIRNSGRFKNGSNASLGYGLLNTRKRLELIYGEEATFAIGDEENGIVLTEITIPIR